MEQTKKGLARLQRLGFIRRSNNEAVTRKLPPTRERVKKRRAERPLPGREVAQKPKTPRTYRKIKKRPKQPGGKTKRYEISSVKGLKKKNKTCGR